MLTSLEKLGWMKTEWEHLKLAKTRKGQKAHAKRLFDFAGKNPEIHPFDVYGESFMSDLINVKILAKKKG